MKLHELKELAEKATPGPWTTETGRYGIQIPQLEAYIEGCIGRPDFCFEEDAAYIAAANPQTILQLIERVEKLSEALKKAQNFASVISDWDNSFPEGINMEDDVWVRPYEIRDQFEESLTQHGADKELE